MTSSARIHVCMYVGAGSVYCVCIGAAGMMETASGTDWWYQRRDDVCMHAVYAAASY